VDGLRMEAGRPVRVETEEAVWVSGAQAAVGLGGGAVGERCCLALLHYGFPLIQLEEPGWGQ
jgi:hypothetical protein